MRLNTVGAIEFGAGFTGVVRDNAGYVPSVATPSVGSSPFTYTAGIHAESVYVKGGTVSAIAIGGQTVFSSTDKVVMLAPGQSAIITYSSAPTLVVVRH